MDAERPARADGGLDAHRPARHTVAVIVNPAAGTRGGLTRAARARSALAARVLAAHGLSGEVLVTERPGHATALARSQVAAGVSMVCAWGGDGTINEVGSALAFQDVALGIVPGGSGNGLARELGIDRRPEIALAGALTGSDRRLDAGMIGGRLFFNIAGIGLDASVARAAGASRLRGLLPYLAGFLHAVASHEPQTYTLCAEGHTMTVHATMVVLANSGRYGFGARVAPHARPDDGLLDLVVVEARSRPALLWQARHLFDGTADRAPGVRTRLIDRLTIASDRPIPYHVDGEVVAGDSSLDVVVHPGAVRVRLPARAPASGPT